MDQRVLNFAVGFLIIFLILNGMISWYYFKTIDPVGVGPAVYDEYVRVDDLEAGDVVSSPLVLTGEARGTWFFEASFVVRVEDDAGNELGYGVATAEGNWMTEEFVPFSMWITFDPGGATQGKLVFVKDNPSGLVEFDDAVEIPVLFSDRGTTVVKLYFNSRQSSPGEECVNVIPVDRSITKIPGIAQVTVGTLLLGPTVAEMNRGFFTSINDGVRINRLVISDGVAEVDFSGEIEDRVGGSCHVTSIRSQIEETLKQFPTVEKVVVSVEGDVENSLQP
jgi:hypothetical protein